MSDKNTNLVGVGPSPDDQPLSINKLHVNSLPAGITAEVDEDKWYHLKVKFVNDNGVEVSGYAYPVGVNASTSFWDYVILIAGNPGKGALKFKAITLDDEGWQKWIIKDDASNSDYHLSCKATGWLYRASAYDVRFRIVDNLLYCNYWNGPVGSTYRSFLVSAGQYAGMDLPPFNCELELVKDTQRVPSMV